MSAHPLADHLTAAADQLATVDRVVPSLVAAAGAFAGDDQGVPGRLGRRMHAHWEAVLTARAREAADTSSRLHELAASVRETSAGYAATDESAARRLEAL